MFTENQNNFFLPGLHLQLYTVLCKQQLSRDPSYGLSACSLITSKWMKVRGKSLAGRTGDVSSPLLIFRLNYLIEGWSAAAQLRKWKKTQHSLASLPVRECFKTSASPHWVSPEVSTSVDLFGSGFIIFFLGINDVCRTTHLTWQENQTELLLFYRSWEQLSFILFCFSSFSKKALGS